MPTLEGPPRRREEIPQFTIIEIICRGLRGHAVEVVQMANESRRYHVTHDKGTLKSPKPSHYFFDTIPQVLNNHERVIQEELGTLHRLPSGDALFIAGDTQRMSNLAERIATLAGSHIALATYEASTTLKDQIAQVRLELGDVRNPYKVAAKQELETAFGTPNPALALDALLAGGLDIVNKNAEDLRIAQGTLGRWRIVFTKRDDVERQIVAKYHELEARLKALQEGKLEGRSREQAARHISGREGLLAQLNRICLPEYWARIQDRDVQRLADFGPQIRSGKDEQAIKILEGAITKLWRVVEERTKRKKGERKK